jgi:60 kDa SS-A/Ro ribonucleoprotein
MTKRQSPYHNINPRAGTPQSEPIPGTVANSAGGYSFPVDHWTRLNRFLILGSEGGTYYISETKLTKENADALFTCIKDDGLRTVNTIVDISVAGRNPKQHPVMFALAACVGAEDETTRRAALDAVPLVCRTGSHLFLFASYVEQFRGWGRGLRNAVAKWYTDRDERDLALQVAKYQSREGWSHRDFLT